MNIINIDMTMMEFQKKPFLNRIPNCPFAMKLYLLSDKKEPLVIASICNLIEQTGKVYGVYYEKESFQNTYTDLDSILNKLEEFYRNSASLLLDKYSTFSYFSTIRKTIIDNWDHFNPSIRKALVYKFNKGKIKTLY